jgi:hypothetical protein
MNCATLSGWKCEYRWVFYYLPVDDLFFYICCHWTKRIDTKPIMQWSVKVCEPCPPIIYSDGITDNRNKTDHVRYSAAWAVAKGVPLDFLSGLSVVLPMCST